MARNPLITKMNAKRFRKRRGAFKPFSDPSTNDKTFVQPELRKFWSERVYTHNGPSKSNIAKEDLGFVNYRDHAKHREDEGPELTPARVAFLHSILGPVKLVSDQRKKIIQTLNELRENPDEYEVGFVVERGRDRKLFLFRNGSGTCFYFVEHRRLIVRSSYTYGSKDRALEVSRQMSIRWKTTRILPSPVPPSS